MGEDKMIYAHESKISVEPNTPRKIIAKLRMVLIAAAAIVVAGEEARGQGPERIAGGGGLHLAIYEAGNPVGPPIVFIHGFTGSYLSWEHQFSGPLAGEFRLIAFDFRGHGASDKPLEAENYTDSALWAEDLAAVIRTKNLDRPVLVGWSYGGYVMADYVRAFGEEAIGGLVFVGAVTKAGTEEAQSFLGEELLEVFGGVLSPDVKTRIESTRAAVRLFTAQPVSRDAFEVMLGSAMMVPPEVRLALLSRELDNDDVLASIGVPTLVIHGDNDRVVRLSSAKHIAEVVPGAIFHAYEGIGHAPFLEDPERFNRDLAEFVRSARRDPSP
jgi:non-heme chloroperoxidase